MNGISGNQPCFGRAARPEEREKIQALAKQHIPNLADRFEKLDVRVIDSKAETLLENACTVPKLMLADMLGKNYELVALQTYLKADGMQASPKTTG